VEKGGSPVLDDVRKDTERRMKKTVEHVREDFSSVRTGRASASLLNRVSVNYYGSPTPLNQIASIAVPEPTLLVVSPYDKSAIGDVEKAILQSELGLNPVNDGNVIRLPIPKLTEERRKEDLHHGQEDIQKLTDRFIAETDEMLKVKEKELMEV
jgi:ribosome recycling factor